MADPFRTDPLSPRRGGATPALSAGEWQTLVTALMGNLRPEVVATMTGVEARDLTAWKDTGVMPSLSKVQKRQLTDAELIYRVLAGLDSQDIVKAWFLGANPFLAGRSPVEVIRQEGFDEVLAAARDFRDNG